MWGKTQMRWALAVFCGLSLSWGQNPARTFSQLDVDVFNDAGIDPQTLREAETRAAQIFRAAEIEVHWRNVGWEQRTTLEPFPPSERIVSLDVRILLRSHDLVGDVFGLAFVGNDGRGQQADVFYGGIATLSGSGACKSAVLLGAVISHELGHLLLGSNSHSATGIMQGHWHETDLQLAMLGEFGFGTAQAVKMQRTIATIERERVPIVGDSRTPARVDHAEVDSRHD
jgi:hypothetical protein